MPAFRFIYRSPAIGNHRVIFVVPKPSLSAIALYNDGVILAVENTKCIKVTSVSSDDPQARRYTILGDDSAFLWIV
jgi:hypothetical protein